mmetsp:Transcript_37764/g.72343  ORF Transcript_37764/g.72343 Transcript_37764/m.72343 type:complete len:501 (-) Transcript_37764:300-1802(-)
MLGVSLVHTGIRVGPRLNTHPLVNAANAQTCVSSAARFPDTRSLSGVPPFPHKRWHLLSTRLTLNDSIASYRNFRVACSASSTASSSPTASEGMSSISESSQCADNSHSISGYASNVQPILTSSPLELSSLQSTSNDQSQSLRSLHPPISDSSQLSNMYPYEKSTAEVYAQTGNADKEGVKNATPRTGEEVHSEMYAPQYAHIRVTLDYDYHFHPTISRQMVQDDIIRDTLQRGTCSDEPWLIFTAGAMGAGKSWCIKRLSEKGYFNDSCFVLVDPDEIRHHLPEFDGYIRHDKTTAGAKTHQEASLMAEIAVAEALRRGKNVLVDSSLRDWKWYKEYFKWVRRSFPQRRIAIIHVDASRELVYERAEKRALATGREVPAKVLDAALQQVPRSVSELAPLCDYQATIVNNHNQLTLTAGDTCWADFRARWQLCSSLGMDPLECRSNTITFPEGFNPPHTRQAPPATDSCMLYEWPSLEDGSGHTNNLSVKDVESEPGEER